MPLRASRFAFKIEQSKLLVLNDFSLNVFKERFRRQLLLNIILND